MVKFYEVRTRRIQTQDFRGLQSMVYHLSHHLCPLNWNLEWRLPSETFCLQWRKKLGCSVRDLVEQPQATVALFFLHWLLAAWHPETTKTLTHLPFSGTRVGIAGPGNNQYINCELESPKTWMPELESPKASAGAAKFWPDIGLNRLNIIKLIYYSRHLKMQAESWFNQ